MGVGELCFLSVRRTDICLMPIVGVSVNERSRDAVVLVSVDVSGRLIGKVGDDIAVVMVVGRHQHLR